jgi:nucleoside-diphosphate-sugar epimerase
MAHVIVGAGNVGQATALLLANQGHQVCLVSRRGQGPDHPGIQNLEVDASNADALTQASEGATAIYNCASPRSYAQWESEWPPMAAGILAAAERSGAVLVTLSNLYSYGPVNTPMTEDMPPAAPGKKGRIRAGMWTDALAAHQAGRVRASEARASDYFGPGFTDTASMGTRTVPLVLNGRTVRVIGDPDMPHTWTYVDDVAQTLVTLGTDERAWGTVWHVPSGPPRSQRDMIAALADAAGVATPKVAAIPNWTMRAIGVVSPVVRELGEVRYQFTAPFVMDSSAFTSTFGLTATPLDQAAAATVAWWKDQRQSSRPRVAA